MEFGQLMADIPVYVSRKIEKYILEIAQAMGENVPIAFLYVLSILSMRCGSFVFTYMYAKSKLSHDVTHLKETSPYKGNPNFTPDI